MINVKNLIATLSDADLLAAADGYFSSLGEHAEQTKKPFSNPPEARAVVSHLGVLLEAADLFPGADVLDFGCATGWLALALSSMGCKAVGVDISPSAVRLANALKQRRWAPGDGPVEFKVYDSGRLPLPDECMDRIVCFDAFHHVRNQLGTLAEMHRVLRPGGIAVFFEPGPHHSTTPQSQREMELYTVIENDIVMPEIEALAHSVGFTQCDMFVQFAKPLRLPVDRFMQWTQSPLSASDATRVTDAIRSGLDNTSCFALTKGTAVLDSRQLQTLGGMLEATAPPHPAPGGGWKLPLKVTNTGTGHWIANTGARGQVNVGGKLLAPGGRLVKEDYVRYEIPGEALKPGESRTLTIDIPPGPDGQLHVRLELVSEGVAWFNAAGCGNVLDISL